MHGTALKSITLIASLFNNNTDLNKIKEITSALIKDQEQYS